MKIARVSRKSEAELDDSVDVHLDKKVGGMSLDSRVEPITWGKTLKEFARGGDVFLDYFYDQTMYEVKDEDS